MQCPSCNVEIHFDGDELGVWKSPDYRQSGEGTQLVYGTCPRELHLVVLLRRGRHIIEAGGGGEFLVSPVREEMIFPTPSPRPLPSEVPYTTRRDFHEAAAVLPISAKASAAISRRMLQQILREQYETKGYDLAAQIEEFISRGDVPSYLSDAVDAIRQVGNLAAHPVKNKHTGEVVDVEPGEAEWLLEVLESLCDFAFVQPTNWTENGTRWKPSSRQ